MATALLTWSGLWPWVRAWRSNRGTTLRAALLWALAAWAGWAAADGLRWLAPAQGGELARYLALSLTCAAGVAVLGARRPGVEAWHFVVAGLLGMLLLPVALFLGGLTVELRLQDLQWLFLTGTLAVIVLNYLPTRLGLAAALFGCGLAIELLQLGRVRLPDGVVRLGELGRVLSPWAAWLCCVRTSPGRSKLDQTWLAFRDRFGLFWGLRAREQFNRAAANAGWALTLGWHGQHPLEVGTLPDPDAVLATLAAILKRFEAETDRLPLPGNTID